MKIITVRNNEITVVPDTALLRNNDPFYAPDFAVDGIEVVSGISARITRLVKCIEPRFAHRTWEEWMECRHHIARGVQPGIGRSFDRSFEVSTEVRAKIDLPQSTQETMDKAIAYVSEYISLRIGDYIFIER